jgi:hypothetical protein
MWDMVAREGRRTMTLDSEDILVYGGNGWVNTSRTSRTKVDPGNGVFGAQH